MKLRYIKYFKRDFNKWSICTLLIVFFISFPVFVIFIKLFSGPGESWNHIVKNLLVDYSLNSLYLIIGCSILTFLFGVSSAWILIRYEIPFQKTLEWMLILPIAIPSYITAYAYAGFFDFGGSLELMSRFTGIPFFRLSITNIYAELSQRFILDSLWKPTIKLRSSR